jgi:hypothetical protein
MLRSCPHAASATRRTLVRYERTMQSLAREQHTGSCAQRILDPNGWLLMAVTNGS